MCPCGCLQTEKHPRHTICPCDGGVVISIYHPQHMGGYSGIRGPAGGGAAGPESFKATVSKIVVTFAAVFAEVSIKIMELLQDTRTALSNAYQISTTLSAQDSQHLPTFRCEVPPSCENPLSSMYRNYA